jgi:hypothetical protein
MGAVLPLPKAGETFSDVRGEDRTMRVSRHDEVGVVVVSLWSGRMCRASFRLPADEAPRLIALLSEAPAEAVALPDAAAEPATAPDDSAGSAEFVA